MMLMMMMMMMMMMISTKFNEYVLSWVSSLLYMADPVPSRKVYQITLMLDRVQAILICTWFMFTKADRPASLAQDIPRWPSIWTSREVGLEDVFFQEITHFFRVTLSCGMCKRCFFCLLGFLPRPVPILMHQGASRRGEHLWPEVLGTSIQLMQLDCRYAVYAV